LWSKNSLGRSFINLILHSTPWEWKGFLSVIPMTVLKQLSSARPRPYMLFLNTSLHGCLFTFLVSFIVLCKLEVMQWRDPSSEESKQICRILQSELWIWKDRSSSNRNKKQSECEIGIWSRGTSEVPKHVVKFIFLLPVTSCTCLGCFVWLSKYLFFWSSLLIFQTHKLTELRTVLFWVIVLTLQFINENKVSCFVAGSCSQGRLSLLHFCDNYAPVCITLQLYTNSSTCWICLYCPCRQFRALLR